MSRIPYQASDMTDAQGLADSIRQRRGGQLYNLDRMLLHSAPFARGWHGFLPAVRGELELSKKLGELAICFVAVLNEADYEFIHHAPVFLSAGGSEAQLAALRSPEAAVVDQQLFSSVERATLKLTLEMTRSVKVSDETFAMIRSQLANEQQLVEIVGVIAAYNMVSRFLVALGVDPE
jgi:alkylhydroperoxidase family enzyme